MVIIIDGVAKPKDLEHSVIPAFAGMTEQGAFYGFIKVDESVKKHHFQGS